MIPAPWVLVRSSPRGSGAVRLTDQWYVGAAGDTNHVIPVAAFDWYTPPPLTVTTSFWVGAGNGLNLARHVAVSCALEPFGSVWPGKPTGEGAGRDTRGACAPRRVPNRSG